SRRRREPRRVPENVRLIEAVAGSSMLPAQTAGHALLLRTDEYAVILARGGRGEDLRARQRAADRGGGGSCALAAVPARASRSAGGRSCPGEATRRLAGGGPGAGVRRGRGHLAGGAANGLS